MLKFNNPDKIFVTSDSHFGHINICRGTSKWSDLSRTRDFNTIDEMNNTIVKGINDKVGPEDILIHLGDWSLGGYDKIKIFREKLNVKTIYLVCGNHDPHMEKDEIRKLFTGVYGNHTTPYYINLQVGEFHYVCGHFCLLTWPDHKKVRHLFGHSHGTLKCNPPLSKDIGMDPNSFSPLNFIEIESDLSKDTFVSRDHHG